MIYVYLALGGAVGTLARYGLGGWIQSAAGPAFPWGTFAVNVLGSLLLGFLVRALEIAPFSLETRAMLTVGFCGAFTTFSTFSLETLALMQEGAWGRAGAYALGSVAVGLCAVALGFALAAPLVRSGI